MTITKDDLIQPTGELDAAFFPEGNMDAYVQGWLDQAAIYVGSRDDLLHPDAATAAYVYSRAFRYLATLWNTLATTTVIAGQITRTINKEQVNFFTNLATHWAERLAIEVPPVVEPTPTGEATAKTSFFTPLIPTW